MTEEVGGPAKPESMLERFRRRLAVFFQHSRNVTKVLVLVWFFVAIGLFSLLIPAAARVISSGWAAGLVVLGAGLFLAGAATVAGSLIGFLFGVPLYRRESHGGSATSPNTNLEQISDWLTKVIVGVSLTQIPKIGAFFSDIGAQWGSAFGDPPAGGVIAISITVHYLVMGFFQGFLLSSLWLPGAMEEARREATPKS